MPTTPVYALRYPASSDPADVPTDMGELATDVETALNGLKYPGAHLAYAEYGTGSVTATTAATASVIAAFGATTFTADPIVITFFSPQTGTPAAAGAQILFNLWDASTDLGIFGQLINPASATFATPLYLTRRLTPTAGSHTYGVRAWVSPSGTGTVNSGSPFLPGFIRIVRA